MCEEVLKLTRLQRFKDCIRGVLLLEENTLLYTLEKDWTNNTPTVSCIPEGLYRCVWQKSHRFGWCYEVRNVLDRSRILIHSGNTSDDSSGCILLGTSYSELVYRKAVFGSRDAISLFHNRMNKQNFKLEIQNAF